MTSASDAPPPCPQSCRLVEAEVKAQLEGSLAVACHVLNVNRELHERLSRQLLTDEKMEGLGLQQALEEVKVGCWGLLACVAVLQVLCGTVALCEWLCTAWLTWHVAPSCRATRMWVHAV